MTEKTRKKENGKTKNWMKRVEFIFKILPYGTTRYSLYYARCLRHFRIYSSYDGTLAHVSNARSDSWYSPESEPCFEISRRYRDSALTYHA